MPWNFVCTSFVCPRRYVILDIGTVDREINSYRVIFLWCRADASRCWRRTVENVITWGAFSPQLTERTGPEAAGPRNDDTFHEGCSVSAKGSSSTRPVDGSWLAARPTDDDRSIDFIADTALTTSQSPALFPARVGRTAIAIYCLSRAGGVTRRPFLHRRYSTVRPNYLSTNSRVVAEMISRDREDRRELFPFCNIKMCMQLDAYT